MHHCSWDMRELKMLQWQWKCVSCGVQFTKIIPNYALGCPLIVECFHPVLGVKVSLCTIFIGTPCSWSDCYSSQNQCLTILKSWALLIIINDFDVNNTGWGKGRLVEAFPNNCFPSPLLPSQCCLAGALEIMLQMILLAGSQPPNSIFASCPQLVLDLINSPFSDPTMGGV